MYWMLPQLFPQWERATPSSLAFVVPAAADWLPRRGLPPTAAGQTDWMKHDLGACEAVRREALTETDRPCSALRLLWFSLLRGRGSVFILRCIFLKATVWPARLH
jgi:hypothetical protein